jgi:ABC-type Mn2+/Zn2+ transport system ATPase subunit
VAAGLVLAHGRTVALDASDFAIPAGAVTSLIGPNGAGKSTILGAIAGLLKPEAGSIEVLGTAPADARRRVAYVFQSLHTDARVPITVHEAVLMGRYARLGLLRRTTRADRSAVDAALERLDVADLRNRQLHELSGGQRQRVLVAQGLAQEAEVLLLDEPVTGLDLPSRQRIDEAVAAERAAGRTVVVSTHELADAAGADHVLLLGGRVVASGPAPDVLTAESLSQAYEGRIVQVGEGTFLVDEARQSPHEAGHHHP